MTSSSTAGGSALQNATDVELQSHEKHQPRRGDTCPLFHAIPMLFGAQSRRAMTSSPAEQVYATLPPHHSPRDQTLPKALAMPIPSEKRLARLARLASFATAEGPWPPNEAPMPSASPPAGYCRHCHCCHLPALVTKGVADSIGVCARFLHRHPSCTRTHCSCIMFARLHSIRAAARLGRPVRTKGRSRIHGMETANSTCPKDGPASCTPHLLERGEPKGECEAKRGEEEMSKRFARQPRPFVCLFCRRHTWNDVR